MLPMLFASQWIDTHSPSRLWAIAAVCGRTCSVQIHRGSTTRPKSPTYERAKMNSYSTESSLLGPPQAQTVCLESGPGTKRFQLHSPTHLCTTPFHVDIGRPSPASLTQLAPQTLSSWGPPPGVHLLVPRQMASASTCAACHLLSATDLRSGITRHSFALLGPIITNSSLNWRSEAMVWTKQA